MIAQARLKEALHYNPDTGIFTRKVRSSNSIKCGQVAGSRSSSDYCRISIDRKKFLAHRLAWLYVYGENPTEIDHIDHDRSNNAISNLREVSRIQNSQNMSISSSNTSGTTGVSINKKSGKWRSHIWLHGKQVSLGVFKNKSNAIIARKMAEHEIGYHANHGIHREN
jgi:hypothetical protein